MEDALPLLPSKDAVCSSVRGVLREVFRDTAYLPPLGDPAADARRPRQSGTLEGAAEAAGVAACSRALREEHAARLARAPHRNKFRVREGRGARERREESLSTLPAACIGRTLLRRADLVPDIDAHATKDVSLWVQNVTSLSTVVTAPALPAAPAQLLPEIPYTDCSVSVGAIRVHQPSPHTPEPVPLPAPSSIVCVPPQIEFVNFKLGELHTVSLRLVNVSQREVRVSITPPGRRELAVELRGRLSVTSGHALSVRVHFAPSDVRTVRDCLQLRDSRGGDIAVPILCYMRPPLLEVLVPQLSPMLSCSSGEPRECCAGDALELGARLLGEPHAVHLLFNCLADNAAFFLLTEDAWLSFSLSELTWAGSVVSGGFVVTPAWWRGGGAVRARAWCRPSTAGLHAAPLRLLASTAVVRPLHLLADALLYRPDHVSLRAQERLYDPCGDADPACEHYLHLGTTFPHRARSGSVMLLNHSPVSYSYYWSVREWGACACSQQRSRSALGTEDELCPGARAQRNADKQSSVSSLAAALVRVEPAGGVLAPRATAALHVLVPDVGARTGSNRAVLMLILTKIPEESFPPDFEPDILNTETIKCEDIPGIQADSRVICEVIHSQLEVWWEVAPLRFVLDPPVLRLHHSLRVERVSVELRATQLFGSEGCTCTWRGEAHAWAPAPTLHLTPAHSVPAPLHVSLLPTVEQAETRVVTLAADSDVGGAPEWESQVEVARSADVRRPRVRPERAWLGCVTPRTHLKHKLQLINDTYENIYWWADAYRWWGENVPSASCAEAAAPCVTCADRACTCSLLRPTRGALRHNEAASLTYSVHAPMKEGVVVTLIRGRRVPPDLSACVPAPGLEARAALVAYRVVTPRLALRLRECAGDKNGECSACVMDQGRRGGRGGCGPAVLRPARALPRGMPACYHMLVQNLTPMPTTVRWQPWPDKEDTLRVTFSPNDFDVGAFANIQITVILEGLRVCSRRVYVARAGVLHGQQPLYCLIDTAITGVEVQVEMPLGGEEVTTASVTMLRTQKEDCAPPPRTPRTPNTDQELFFIEDQKRADRQLEVCECCTRMVYIPPERRPRKPPELPEDRVSIDVVSSPPPLTRVCACREGRAPVVPQDAQPYCLQFWKMPLRTVWSRTIWLRNVSRLPTRWRASLRRWGRRDAPREQRPLGADPWSLGVHEAGACVQVSCARGVLPPGARAPLTVRAYADTWGLYHDQLLLQMDHLEPLVLDVWVECDAPPLALVTSHPRSPDACPLTAELLQPTSPDMHYDCTIPTLWMSASDPERVLRARNTSRCPLLVYAHLFRNKEPEHHVLPFRVYLRFYDVPPRTCPCVFGPESSGTSVCSSLMDNDTGVEVFIEADYGLQDNTFFTVTPECLLVEPGDAAEWRVSVAKLARERLSAGADPHQALLLRPRPQEGHEQGLEWFRPAPRALPVLLRMCARVASLEVSANTLHVTICALDLPVGDVTRVRKRLRAQNVGTAPLTAWAHSEAPWSVVGGRAAPERRPCRRTCAAAAATRQDTVQINLLPNSSVELCLEVCVAQAEVVPRRREAAPTAPTPRPSLLIGGELAPQYPPVRYCRNTLSFYDEHTVLKTVNLLLELDYPRIKVEPELLDFGYVCVDNVRKGYFTVRHTSRTRTLDLDVQWFGGSEFEISPHSLRIPPEETGRIYIQFTSRYTGCVAEGVVVCISSASWCRGGACARAQAARDYKCHLPVHDHTDDTTLLPADTLALL